MVSNVGSSKGGLIESLPSDLSQADTQRNSQLSIDSAMGGRGRSSWQKRVSGLFQRSSEALRTENKLTKPNPNAPKVEAVDSPTDPMYNPETKTFRAELPAKDRSVMEKRISKETTKSPIDAAMKSFKSSAAKIDMPPIAVTGPDEPRSFLDLDTSDDEDTPIVQRASSVRVAKPHIVRHNSTSAVRVPKISGDSGPSMEKAGQLLGEDLRNLYDLNPSQKIDSLGGPADALKLLEGDGSVDDSTVALPPTPPSRSQTPKESIRETIVDVPDSNKVAMDSRATLDTGIRSQEAEIVPNSGKQSSQGTPTFNPLRANPLSELERRGLSRTMSAPLPPNRHPNRRVQIRPADIITHTDDDHRVFRESIITTPYPNRLSMVNEGTENRLSAVFDEKHISPKLTALPDLSTGPAVKPIPAGQTSITPTPVEKTGDRFPSPSQTEHLFLTLSLPSPVSTSPTTFQTSPSTIIEIAIKDSLTFDDEELFYTIRRAYLRNLLGLSRRLFFSRTLSHVTPGSNDMVLDTSSFVAHLSRPKLGRNKKGWLIWLRNQQPLPKRASSMFSGHSPDGAGHMYPHSHHSHSGSHASNVSSYWSPNSHANGVPRMPFSRVQSRDLPPRLVLHYRFSVLAITTALFIVGLLSLLSTVSWVLFGVPGQAAGEDARETIFGNVGWKTEAEFRVLTGLVLGIAVGLGGCGVVGAWCLGGWVLV